MREPLEIVERASARSGSRRLQRLAAAMDVGLDLAERRAERVGDLLVVQLLEVKQHQRHALVIGQRPQRPFELLAQLRLLELSSDGENGRHQRVGVVGRRPSGRVSSLKNCQRAR